MVVMNFKTKKATSANVASKNSHKRKRAFIKNVQHKHTVKLRSKQPDLLSYIIKVLLGTLPTVCYILTSKAFSFLEEVGVPLELPNSLYLLSILIFLLNTIYVFHTSPISFSNVQRLKNILRKIIEVNGFFYENKELNKITLSMTVKFYWIEDNLYLEVYTAGGQFTHKMNELTSILQTGLNMTVVSVQDDFADHTTYILSNNYVRPINIGDEWS